MKSIAKSYTLGIQKYKFNKNLWLLTKNFFYEIFGQIRYISERLKHK